MNGMELVIESAGKMKFGVKRPPAGIPAARFEGQ